jgi:hypothetical protein
VQLGHSAAVDFFNVEPPYVPGLHGIDIFDAIGQYPLAGHLFVFE